MGLFNIFKNEKSENSDNFIEEIVITENVNEALLSISKKYNISLSSLDFDLLNIKTYIKFENDDFIEADEEAKALLKNKEFLLNEKLDIKQVYEIKIKKYKPINGFEILGKIEINSLFTEANFILSHKSDLIKYNEVKFLEEIQKKKLKNSLLINIFDENLKKDIKSLSEKIINGPIKEDITIKLCKGIEPIKSIQGRVNYFYRKRKKSIKKELIYPIKKEEILIEIIKPKEGRIGRNCKGKIIEVEKISEFKIPEINYDSNVIEKKENDEKILFIAKKDGYVVYQNNTYTIKDKLEIRQINIKTGNVTNADKSQVKIDVKESDVLKEAIADDMTVETKELIVRGNVGNKAKIKTITLKIEGQTHKNSIIYSKSAKINKHKGFLKAENVYINSLEGGEIRAKKVKIKNAIGGSVIAEEIEIENLLSHTKLFGLKKIIIINLKGEENLLSINPKKVLDNENVDSLRKKVEEYERNISILKKEILKIKSVLDKNSSAYENLKNRYKINKEKNKPTSPAILMKIKEYRNLIKKYENLKDKLQENEKLKDETLDFIDNIQNAIYNAKIISKSPWKAFNRIEFDLLEPPISLKYDTKGDEGVCGFKLKFYGDTPKIVKIKVNNDSSS